MALNKLNATILIVFSTCEYMNNIDGSLAGHISRFLNYARNPIV